MKAITLWQPWASWIAAGWKTIETRTHTRFASLAGQRIAIHAGKKWDRRWSEIAGGFLDDDEIKQTPDFRAVRGVVVCRAFVVEHRRLYVWDSAKALCPAGGLWGLVLMGVDTFSDPPAATGHQRIWNWQLPSGGS